MHHFSVGELLINTTHASHAFVYKNVSGNTWIVSQPLTSWTPPTITFPSEVDTWATGDAVTAYTLPLVNLVVHPTDG